MANSYVLYEGNGVTKNFTVSFSFLSRDHVTVKLNGSPALYPMDWQWVSDSTITFTTAPLLGAAIEIVRVTPKSTRLVDFTSGAVLTESDLDTAHLQHFYSTQEIIDTYGGTINAGLARIADAGGVVYTSADELINAIATEVMASTLTADLQARIIDIDLNAESLLDLDTRAVIIEEDMLLLGARNVAGSAFILDKDKIIVDSVSSETLATRLTTISSTLGSNTTAVAVNASSISGIEGKYTVKIDNNGYVSGYGLISTANNGIPTSEFTVLVDKFAIIDAAQTTGTPVVPFVVTGGVVYMQNVVIGGALIEDASIGNAKIASLQATKITAGNISAAIGLTTGSINVSSSGKIYSGKTTFSTAAAGWFLGLDSGTPKFRIGNADNSKSLTWDGSNLVVAGGIIGGSVVASVPLALSDTSNEPISAAVAFKVTTNRTVEAYEGTPFTYDIRGTWLLGGKPTSDYQVRLSKTSGDSPTSGAVDTWLTCSSDRTWTMVCGTGTSPCSKSFVGKLQFRQVGGTDIIDEAAVTMATVLNP